MDVLNQKHRLFVEAYCGDVVTAMQLAGYVGDEATLEKRGRELLTNPNVEKAIRERSKYLAKTKTAVAHREERQEFWTAIMRNQDPHYIPEKNEMGVVKPRENIPLAQRLKASEMLGKSEADFSENINVKGTLTVTDIITRAYEISDEELDAIEAEYEEIYGTRNIEEKTTEEVEDEVHVGDLDDRCRSEDSVHRKPTADDFI